MPLEDTASESEMKDIHHTIKAHFMHNIGEIYNINIIKIEKFKFKVFSYMIGMRLITQ